MNLIHVRLDIPLEMTAEGAKITLVGLHARVDSHVPPQVVSAATAPSADRTLEALRLLVPPE